MENISRNNQLASSIEAFSKYNESLKETILNSNDIESLGAFLWKGSSDVVERNLRSLIPIKDLRETGSFFTGDELADEAIDNFEIEISDRSRILDPTCGAGNLLIACSKRLPVFKSIEKTLELWGNVLEGWDLFPEFVEATKLRLIQESIGRGCEFNGSNIDKLKDYLVGIKQKDALAESHSYERITHLVSNPPFGLIKSPMDCGWSSGQVNAASCFFNHILQNLGPEAIFTVILPEVLRSGTRYEKWRTLIDNKVNHKLKIAGRFDSSTNVDVFLLSGRMLDNKEYSDLHNNWGLIEYGSNTKVGDRFHIFIGPVVPYRDKEDGEIFPYIYPKILPKWEELNQFDYQRKFSGRVVKPPFIAIRRTSSPSDKHRAAATLIVGKRAVAVENHLIVAKPIKRGLGECRQLLKILQNHKTDDFLNNRIRCRHLTSSAVKEIPWEEV